MQDYTYRIVVYHQDHPQDTLEVSLDDLSEALETYEELSIEYDLSKYVLAFY